MKESETERPVRIGAVTYLNTVPLVRGLAELLPEAELSFDHPSRLADQLGEGSLDIALAPSIELARHPEWTIISTACIGCRGPVLSVKLLFRTSPEAVRRLAVDEGSRTSIILSQILLADRFSVRPQLEPLPVVAAPESTTADAVLVIGDRAIAPPSREFREAWDLGREWRVQTGLPFVFAAWFARPGIDVATIEPALDAARDQGCREFETIANEQSVEMGMPREVVLQYLRDHLNFYLGDGERHGLELFFQRAATLELIPRDFQLKFDGCTAER